MPWPVGQVLLEDTGIPRGKGWDNTVAKLSNGLSFNEDQVESLTDGLSEHLLCGEKASSFYSTDSNTLANLRAAASGLTIPESLSQSRYPVLLTDAELATEPREQRLISVEERDDGTAVVFSSIRTMIIREVITQDDLPEDASDILAGYEEVIGIKHKLVQCIDVAWIPASGSFIDLRTDFPQGMYVTQANFAGEQLSKQAGLLLGTTFDSPQNLFPLIHSMYSAADEGTVVELAFGTTTASIKHEKMRRAGQDLRQEIYHRAGKAALDTPIEPYRLSISWKRKVNETKFSRPEMSLFSDSRIAYGQQPILTQAGIRKCVSADDYNFIRERICYYLSQQA